MSRNAHFYGIGARFLMMQIFEMPERKLEVRVEQYPTLAELDRDSDEITRARLDYAVVIRTHRGEIGPIEERRHGPIEFKSEPTLRLKPGLIRRILTAPSGPWTERILRAPLPAELPRGCLLVEAVRRGLTPGDIWGFAINHGGGTYIGGIATRDPAQVLERSQYQSDKQLLEVALQAILRLWRQGITVLPQQAAPVPGAEPIEVTVPSLAPATFSALVPLLRDSIAQLEAHESLLPPKTSGRPTREPKQNNFFRDWSADNGLGVTLFNAIFDEKMTRDTFYVRCSEARKTLQKPSSKN
ncbi:MAG: hypothetical protein JO166_19260 [Deltaproteobacteria bacterium]|nr:hypothetical protein [Deltaproteobacteria bacterium]